MSRTKKRVMLVGDSHGNKIDPRSPKEIKHFINDFKPDLKVHMGDWADLACLRNGASPADKQEGMNDDINAGYDFLDLYDPDLLCMGNHDERIFRLARSGNSGELRQLARLQIDQIVDFLGKLNCDWIPYDKNRYFEIGDYFINHGFNANLHAAYKAASHYGNYIMGHVHTSGMIAFPHARHPSVGHTCGCLCRTDMDYNVTHLAALRQNRGLMYGILYKGQLHVNHFNLDSPSNIKVMYG